MHGSTLMHGSTQMLAHSVVNSGSHVVSPSEVLSRAPALIHASMATPGSSTLRQGSSTQSLGSSSMYHSSHTRSMSPIANMPLWLRFAMDARCHRSLLKRRVGSTSVAMPILQTLLVKALLHATQVLLQMLATTQATTQIECLAVVQLPQQTATLLSLKGATSLL